MWHSENLLARLTRYAEGSPPRIQISRGSEIGSNLYWTGTSPVFLISPHMAVFQGGYPYNRHHPFVQTLFEGPLALERFYKRCAPESLAEMYKIPSTGLVGETLPPWELPWLTRTRGPPGAEGWLGIEHGVSYYGPCTSEKIDFEYRRLVSLVMKIRCRGYLPERFGYIEGHFLRRGEEFRFFVRGGKHRAAVLTYLGYDLIPVRVRQSWPRVIEAGREHEWPLVTSGDIDVNLAMQIFGRYFQVGD